MKKYVVMKDFKGSMYVSELIESLEDAKDNIHILEVINNSDHNVLPMRVNEFGGWCIFNPRDRSFVRIIEAEEWPVLTLEEVFPVNHKYFDCGWIAPDGLSYFCDECQHIECAEKICNKYYDGPYIDCVDKRVHAPDNKLLNLGWIKVFSNGTFFANPDKVQKNTILFAMSKKIIPETQISSRIDTLIND